MWLENLKALKKEKGMSSKQIADMASMTERTVSRIFSGDTGYPYMDTLHRIVTALGGSLDDIFADTKAVVGDQNLVEVKETATVAEAEREIAVIEKEALQEKVAELEKQNAVLRDRIEALRDKVDTLKDEIIETHKYYNMRNQGGKA